MLEFYKQPGVTPLQFINNIKKQYPDKKICYTARLDPMARGKIPVLFGDECKNMDKYTNLSKTYENNLVNISFGERELLLENIIDIDNRIRFICIDVANGFNERVKTVIQELKQFGVDVMAGNVCNPQGFEFLCQAGADCIRVGIRNGSICSTRLVTGVGSGQFSLTDNFL